MEVDSRKRVWIAGGSVEMKMLFLCMALVLLLGFSETKHRAMYKYSTGYKQ
jgi:hypothetical protein